MLRRGEVTSAILRRARRAVGWSNSFVDVDLGWVVGATGVYDWVQKIQDKQREVELNLQYNHTVTQHGLKMLEKFRNVNPREALVSW